MRFDIIISAYHATYLEQTVKSAVAQNYRNFDITVVDNHSPNNNIVDICNKYNVNYIRSDENNGPAGARNIGIKNTKNDLISFIDDDDIMCRDKLRLSYESLKDYSIGMTCGNYRILANRVSLTEPFYRKNQNINWSALMNVNLVASGSVSIKRSVVDDIGLFNEEYWIAEDYDYWLRVSEKYNIKYIHDVLYFYSVIKNNISLTQRNDIQLKHMSNLEKIKEESRVRINYGKNI